VCKYSVYVCVCVCVAGVVGWLFVIGRICTKLPYEACSSCSVSITEPDQHLHCGKVVSSTRLLTEN
jgi:hypothetical protein